MSEKKVNVKITASISEFEKAIKKAQKEVKELTDVLEDINKNKFGENLEKQFKDISDAAEKMQDQLEDMKDTLDDIEKIKLDKVEKEFEDIAEATEDLNDKLEDTVDKLEKLNKTKADKLKDDLEDTSEAAEDLNETLEDTKESVEDLAKTKLDKLEQQYKDVLDTADKLNEAVEDNQEALSELDKTDVDRLRNSLEDIAESSEDIGERLSDLRKHIDDLDSEDLNSLESEFEQVGSAIEDLGDKVRNTADDIDTHLNETLRDTDERVEKLTDSVEDLGDEFSDIDGLEDVKDDFKKLFGDKDISVNLEGDKNGFFDNLADGFISGSIAGDKLSDAVQDIVDGVDRLADSMRDVNQFTFDEQIKNYDDFINKMVKAQDEYNDALKERNELESKISNIKAERDAYTKQIEETRKKMDDAEKEYIDLTKAIEEQRKVVQNLEKAYDNLIDTDTGMKKLKEECEDARREIERLEDDVRELGLSFKMDADGNKLIDTSNYEKAGRELDKINEKMEKLQDSLSRRSDFSGFLDKKGIQDEEIRDLANAYKQLWDEIDSGENIIENCAEEMRDLLDAMVRIDKESGAFGGYMQAVKGWFNEYQKASEEADRLTNIYYSQMSVIDDLTEAQKRYNKALEDYEDAKSKIGSGDLDEERNKLEQLEDKAKKAQKAFEDLAEEWSDLQNADQFARLDGVLSDKKIEEINANMEALNETLEKGNKIAEDAVKGFNDEYKMYEKLSKKVKEYLEDEEKSIVLREKVAKSFKQVSDAMESVYKDSGKLNNADLITKTLAEAADYIKELDLVSTDNLQRDLTRLGEIIDDKTEKIKRFKELNKTFGSDDGKTAHWLEQESKAIKEFIDKTGIAIEAADTLRKAWGDVSIGGEDHLKIRARAEALSTYGETIKKQVREIRKAYQDLNSLDDMLNSDKVSDEDKLKIKDYQAWEKSREELIKYNKAIEDYIVTIRDANGQISDKFLTDGKFDIDKFIADFEKMGASSAVLSKQFNANKIALQEWLKAEKEVRKAAVENAKLALEQAKADEKAAKSKQEIREATERVTKAQEELNEARKKLENFSIDASKEVKQLNELAESMRKLGMAAEDLGKSDVSKFDKSLASLMDSLGAFGDGDIPSTFSDFKEDFMAMFESLDSFDLGGVADGLKDIFSGIFAGLPAEAKAAIAIISSVVVALDKLYEAGKRDFFEGLSKAGEALGKVADITRDIGQEIGDAFSSITGMDLDFSSLIQIPIDFESQMAKTGAIAGATGEAFEELEAKARELGSTTRYSATEVAEAMEYMGMAGWNNTEILAGLESVLNLATVSGMDLGKASDFVTDGLTALNMEAKDAAYMVDLLAAASTSSNTTVDQMQRAFTNCAPVAGTLGITMKDLSIALGLMADKGVKGAKAGTALKNLMANMSAPTKEQLAYIKEFNLEGAQQDIVNGRLVDGLKKFKAALADLSPQQQNAIIKTIAGREALSGISALLNTTEADLADLEKAMNECSGSAAEMAENFDDTVKGALLGLASAMQETLLQVFDKVKDGIKDVTGQLTEFFNIINGFSQEGNGSGLEDAFTYLEKVSQGWGEALTKGIESAFKTLDEFVNTKGGIFDNVIQVGTNIINGICDGILEAEENGSLSNTIDGLIKKISNWIIENGPKVEKVGIVILEALREGIENNEGLIGDAMDVICDIIASWTDSSGKLEATAGKFAEQFVALSIKNMFSKAKNWIREKGSALSELLTGPFTGGGFVGMTANVVTNLMDNLLGVDPIGDAKRWIKEKFGNWHPIQAIKDYFAEKKAEKGKDGTIKPKDIIKLPSIKECIDHIKNWFNGLSIVKTIKEALSKNNKDTSDNKIKPESIIKIPSIKDIKTFISDKLSGFNLLETIKNILLGASKTTPVGKATSAFIKMADIFGNWDPVQDAKNWLDDKIGNWSITKWIKDKFSGKSTDKKSNNKKSNDKNKSTETEEINIDTLVNIDTKELKAVEESLKTLQTTAQTAAGVVRENFLSMANVARNQMLNVSNIIRNQALSWSNIISNQVLNARNAFTTQMLSMAAVARTQMLNVSNIIRNQALSWANIIRNQILNARNGFTQQMLSMAAVARTQMVNVTNIIRNQSLSWANIISNQAKRARDNFTRQMMSMVKVARNQMYNVLTTVRSYMSQISGATNKSINVKVNKSITSSNTGGGGSLPVMPAMASALHAANAASTLSIGNMGALAHSNSYGMSTGGGGSSFSGSSSGSMTIEIPVMLDGRELARASAKYVDNELKVMSNRENRKRGAK